MLMQNRADLFKYSGTARALEKLLKSFGQVLRYLSADRGAIGSVALLDFAADVNDAAGYPHIARDQRQRVEQLLPQAQAASEFRKRGKRRKITAADAVAAVTPKKAAQHKQQQEPVMAGAGK